MQLFFPRVNNSNGIPSPSLLISRNYSALLTPIHVLRKKRWGDNTFQMHWAICDGRGNKHHLHLRIHRIDSKGQLSVENKLIAAWLSYCHTTQTYAEIGLCYSVFFLSCKFFPVNFKTEVSRIPAWHQASNWFVSCLPWTKNRFGCNIQTIQIMYSADNMLPAPLAKQVQFEITLY